MEFKSVVCAPGPLVFIASQSNCCVWVTLKRDALVEQSLRGCPVIGASSDVARLITQFLAKYMLVVYTQSKRIKFADMWVLDELNQCIQILGTLMYTQEPYVDDDRYLFAIRRALGGYFLLGEFGNHRIYMARPIAEEVTWQNRATSSLP